MGSDGTFSLDVPLPASNFPAGRYATTARNVGDAGTTNAALFAVTASVATSSSLTILAPVAGATESTVVPVVVRWTDVLRLAPGLPAAQGIYRTYRYKVGVLDGAGACVQKAEATGSERHSTLVSLSKEITLSAGTYQSCVADLAEPNRTVATGPSFTVAAPTATSLAATLKWDYSFSTRPTARPIGVVTDGVARVYVQVTSPMPLTEVTLSLRDAAGRTSRALLGAVMPATVTSAYSEEASGATATSATARGNATTYTFWYVSPSEHGMLLNEASRTVQIAVSGRTATGAATPITIPVTIKRPPLLLVHGLASSGAMWNGMSLSLIHI